MSSSDQFPFCNGRSPAERQDRFAGFVHWFDVFLESLRGSRNAKLAAGVYDNCGTCNRYTTDAGDKGSSVSSLLPMRMVLASAATPALPISILLLPVVRLLPALAPKAMLELPVVLRSMELMPRATFRLPVVLEKSALTPTPALLMPMVLLLSACRPSAVLFLPMVLLKSALKPVAVLFMPVVLLTSASKPLAVLLLPVCCSRARRDRWLCCCCRLCC